MASVTPDQKRRDSLGSCFSVGGRTLGATLRGHRSMIRCWVSCDAELGRGIKEGRKGEHALI